MEEPEKTRRQAISPVRLENQSLGPGDKVYTYVKRGSPEAEIRYGVIQAVLEMPSIVPQEQYVLMVDGVLVIRDAYTCALEAENIKVFDRANDTHLYHD